MYNMDNSGNVWCWRIVVVLFISTTYLWYKHNQHNIYKTTFLAQVYIMQDNIKLFPKDLHTEICPQIILHLRISYNPPATWFFIYMHVIYIFRQNSLHIISISLKLSLIKFPLQILHQFNWKLWAYRLRMLINMPRTFTI